jgi:hypothetical protein
LPTDCLHSLRELVLAHNLGSADHLVFGAFHLNTTSREGIEVGLVRIAQLLGWRGNGRYFLGWPISRRGSITALTGTAGATSPASAGTSAIGGPGCT